MALSVEGHPFASRLVCSRCGSGETTLVRPDRLPGSATACRACAGALVPSGFHLLDRLELVPPSDPFFGDFLDRPLSALGLQPGDVFRLTADGREKHLELGAD
jgi:ribosomal protein L40E